MIWLILLSFSVIASYTLAVCVKQKGIPYSISATFYKLAHPWLFAGAMYGTAALLMPAALELSKPGAEWLAFLACTGMFMIGSAPDFKDRWEGRVHDTGALLCIAGSQGWVAVHSPWMLCLWAAYSIGTLLYMANNEVTDDLWRDFMTTRPVFWVEATAIATVFLTALTLL